MARIGDKLTAGNMIMVVIIAIAAVYLWGTFTEPKTGFCTAQDITEERFGCDSTSVAGVTERSGLEFTAPDEKGLEGSTLWIIKLMIIGGAVWIGWGIVSKFIGRNMTRRDIMSIVLLGVAVYFIWTYLIEPSNLLGATQFACEAGQQNCEGLTLDKLASATAQKLGLA